jgi:hypothetical protein
MVGILSGTEYTLLVQLYPKRESSIEDKGSVTVRQDQAQMIAYAQKWLPYGGGDEHILPEFGLVPAVFYRRLLRLMNTVGATQVELGSRRQLVELCSLKLAHVGREEESLSRSGASSDQSFDRRRRSRVPSR